MRRNRRTTSWPGCRTRTAPRSSSPARWSTGPDSSCRAYVSVSSEPETYGKFTVLELPAAAETQTQGPAAGPGTVPGVAGGESADRPAVPSGPDHRRLRQPAHAPGRGRAAVRRARLHRTGGPERRFVPRPGSGPGELQRPGRLRREPGEGVGGGVRGRRRLLGDGAGSDGPDTTGWGHHPAAGGRGRRCSEPRGRRVGGGHPAGAGAARRRRNSPATSPPRARRCRHWTPRCSGSRRPTARRLHAAPAGG